MSLQIARRCGWGEISARYRPGILIQTMTTAGSGVVATAASDALLLAHLVKANVHEASLREMQRQQSLAGTRKANYVPEMTELDGRVDRQHHSIGSMLDSHIKGEDPDPEIRNKAQQVRDALYPMGVAAVTRLAYLLCP